MAYSRGSANRVILVGHVGADPEVRYTPSGVAVANFNLATNETWTDNDGNRQERTDWHRVVAWRQLAELCEKFVDKGTLVYIEGKLQTRSWEDRNGVKRYTTEVVADSLTMLGGRGQAAEPAPQEDRDAMQPEPDEDMDDLPF
ncbi:MAG TPA: single-stranded DNA-binding protein [bacterium]|nr:single-stranded DNA-binding protein [bacterium]